MSSAGQQLISGRVPGERIGTSIETSDSGTFTTTETQGMSVTVPVIAGQTYRIRGQYRINWTSVSSEPRIQVRIREDVVTTGTQLQIDLQQETGSTGSTGIAYSIEAEWTATSTENKTFILSAQRANGTATLNFAAGVTSPSYFYVDYIRG